MSNSSNICIFRRLEIMILIHASLLLQVDFDKTKHLADSTVKKRAEERDKLAAEEREKEDAERRKRDLEELKRAQEL